MSGERTRRRWRGRAPAACLGIAIALVAGACSGDTDHDEQVGLHQIQTLGTHNSYKLAVPEELLAALEAFDADLARSLDYAHPPLAEQLERLGARQLELDVFADPDGGRFATRHANPVVGLPADADDPALSEPGFKVLHVQEVDYASSCVTFVTCLEEVRDWSRERPDHLPVLVLVEVKDAPIPDPLDLGFVEPHPVGPAELDALDAEIRSVFDDHHVLTPDDVRGAHDTLREVIVTEGWPILAEARGRVLFALDNTDGIRDAYLEGHPALSGRVMFASVEPDDPAAAFVKLNDPVADGERITALVEQGFLVRTRADADTEQARTGDTARRDAALASGAQFVSSDYLEADRRFGDYRVQLPGGAVARCNPVSAPPSCEDEELSG